MSRYSQSLEKLASAGLLLALGVATGCGDARHSLGGAATQLKAYGCEPGATIDMIDDMEDADGSLFLTHGRAGVWFSYNDETNQDTTELTKQWPRVSAERFYMDQFSPGRGGSRRAAHTHGAGYTKWGAGIGFDLLVQQPYDASKYAGVTFFLSGGASDGEATVRLNVPDRNTSPLGGECDAGNNCYGDFGFDLVATDGWQQIWLPWSWLSQPSWAVDRYDSIVTSAIYGIRFQTPPGAAFDFWIDDIAFLCVE